MRLRLAIVPVAAMLLTAAIHAQVNFGIAPIKWSNFQSGGDSQIAKDTTTVLNTDNQWQRFWEKMTGNHGVSAPGGIDWGKELLVAVVLTNRMAGTNLLITDVSRTNPSTVQVTYVEQKPGIQPPTGGTTSPYVVIRMDRAAADVKFVRGAALQAPSLIGGGERRTKSDLSWSTYAGDVDCSLGNAGVYVFHDQGSFNDYWLRLNGNSDPAPQDVDWTREMLIAIQMGEQPSNGYDITVESLRLTPTGLLVKAFYKTPDFGQHVRQQSTSPYVIIRTASVPGDVAVERRSKH